MRIKNKDYRAVWMVKKAVKMIDQRLLPHKFKIISLKTHRETAGAIRDMAVRGAGSIGAAAAFASVQVVQQAQKRFFPSVLSKGFSLIRTARPTAQDLFYAVDKIEAAIAGIPEPASALQAALACANRISDQYSTAGKKIGILGNRLIRKNTRVLTHCNAGWIALQDWGSALAPIHTAAQKGKNIFVYVNETRPRMQGAKLTAWELAEAGIDYAIIADNASGHYMRNEKIDICMVGADRIARNGDVANKIGTYEKAVLAKENRIPFYVAAPTSTIDLNCRTGGDIPIEERDEKEVLEVSGKTRRGTIETVRVAGPGAKALNPAFDVTPARFITGIITEKGIFRPGKIARAMRGR